MRARLSHRAVAGSAWLTVTLSVAVAAGLIPMPHQTSKLAVSTTGSSSVTSIATNSPPTTLVAASRAKLPLHSASGSPASTAAAGVAAGKTANTQPSTPGTAPAATSTTSSTAGTAPHSTPGPTPTTPTTPAPTKHATPTTTPKPRLAARTQPSAAAVQNAIQGLGAYVHSFLTPTAAQVAQFGDLVCTAFDQGQTFAQIINTVNQKVQGLPLTTVLPGAANYVVRTAVALYCPGYTSKLG